MKECAASKTLQYTFIAARFTMTSHFGLVCITHSNKVRYRTITFKRLLQHSEEEKRSLLHALYAENIQRFRDALTFCRQEDISLYRISSSIFPFSDVGTGQEVLSGFS